MFPVPDVHAMKHFLEMIALLAVLSGEARPNVVIIFADDLG